MGTIIIGTITGLFILALIIFTIKYWGKYTSHILKIFKKCMRQLPKQHRKLYNPLYPCGHTEQTCAKAYPKRFVLYPAV